MLEPKLYSVVVLLPPFISFLPPSSSFSFQSLKHKAQQQHPLAAEHKQSRSYLPSAAGQAAYYQENILMALNNSRKMAKTAGDFFIQASEGLVKEGLEKNHFINPECFLPPNTPAVWLKLFTARVQMLIFKKHGTVSHASWLQLAPCFKGIFWCAARFKIETTAEEKGWRPWGLLPLHLGWDLWRPSRVPASH